MRNLLPDKNWIQSGLIWAHAVWGNSQKFSSSDLIIETVKIKHLMEFKDYRSFSEVYNWKVILMQVNCDGAFRALLTCPNKAVVLN